MVTHAQTTQKVLNKITKTLEVLAKNDKVCQLIQTIPGLGTICSCRLRATIGDIKRFKNPKDFPPYYGLVPRSIATGHNEVFNGARGRMCDPLGHLWKIKIQTVNEVDFEEAKRKNAVGKTSMRRCRKAFTDR